ncbi:putative beta-lysine N-acetyltransferase [Bacillus sp. CGMCC 1.16607]|uniref:putative beta-lysine N-acetyltransferase n=1 Tax=Bacillus sp. CGMCC 1.16607 TaxID=3351842 RepID=UPI00363F927F
MNDTATQFEISEKGFWLQVYDDPFNKRTRIDDYFGNTTLIIDFAEEWVKQKKREKLIFKVRKEQFSEFIQHGFTCEALIDHYYLGSDAYFFTKYYEVDRLKNDHWLTEDQTIQSIQGLKISSETLNPPIEFHLKKVEESDVIKLSELYQTVFQIYPTPLHDPEYIKKTLKEGTIYYSFYWNDQIVSAASAEVNRTYRNAELTDCATLNEHRKHGLMKILLKKLENELYDQGIYCSYSIARSLSFGMNAVLHQLGYVYRGRLKNNVFIFDKLENMNVWVKNLANEPNFRQ